jgi:hypothetical protein
MVFYQTISRSSISHGGDTLFFHAMLSIIPEQKLGVIVPNNSNYGILVFTECY